jgi:hypothetical protein
MHRAFSRFVVSVVAGAMLLSAQNASADPVTFNFTGSQGGAFGEGSMGNTRTLTAGGVTLTVTAWGYTYGPSDNALAPAALGRWNAGLGVCNATETPCSSPRHQLDNSGADDWMLFVFSTPVDITSVRIDPYGSYGRDVSYYLGNVTTPLNLTGKNYGNLAALGFGSIASDTASASDNYRDVTIVGGYVNALLLGGYLGGNDQDDYFKVRSVTASTPPPPPTRRVPEPGTLFGVLIGSGALGLRKRQHANAK